MIQIAPQIRILVAVEAVDGRKGTSMSCAQTLSGAKRTTFTGSTFLSGETTFAARHFAWNGKRILFSR